jgi:hypothetical protein
MGKLQLGLDDGDYHVVPYWEACLQLYVIFHLLCTCILS